jgi:hypothetical protein
MRIVQDDCCYESDIQGGSECSFMNSGCPESCIFYTRLYRQYPELLKSAQRMITDGAHVLEGFAGYLYKDTSKGREIYTPSVSRGQHHLRNVIDVA